MDSIQSCFRCSEKDLGGAGQQPPTPAGSSQPLLLASFPHSKMWELGDGSASCGGVFGIRCALFGVRGVFKLYTSELSARRR